MSKLLNTVYYCGAWGRGFENIPDDALRCLDILFYSNAEVSADNVRFNNPPEAANVANLHERRPEMPVILSTVGYSSVAESRGSIADAAKRVVGAAIEAGFDGVDVDWEFPANDQAYLHTHLLACLRAELDRACEENGKRYYLTAAIPTTEWVFDITELDRSHVYLDYVNVMTYDIYSERKITCHHSAPLPWSRAPYPCASFEENLRLLIGRGIPAEKIIGGGAYYSRIWTDVENGGEDGLGVETKTPADYGPQFCQITDEYIKGNYKFFRDPESQAPWLWNGSTFITYEDATSLAVKCDIVKKLGAAGMMAWEYACDTPDHTLLKFQREKLS
ncbi:MAG: hypothetical protein IJC50_05365 [Clostridia bacterium]|nr:hypothetical protein [Clostridia bacterium]